MHATTVDLGHTVVQIQNVSLKANDSLAQLCNMELWVLNLKIPKYKFEAQSCAPRSFNNTTFQILNLILQFLFVEYFSRLLPKKFSQKNILNFQMTSHTQ